VQSFARKLIVYHREHVRNRRGTAKPTSRVPARPASTAEVTLKGLRRRFVVALTVPLGPRQNTDRASMVARETMALAVELTSPHSQRQFVKIQPNCKE
jgi:hypothetical protein